MRYLDYTIKWWTIWYDLACVELAIRKFFGLACRHPKKTRVDYGRLCGLCPHKF